MTRRALSLLLLAAPACSLMGHATEETVEAAGVVGTAAVATPAVGIVSWPFWNWVGGWAGEEVSGTTSVRVPAAQTAAPQQPVKETDMDLLTLILLAALVFLGREVFALKGKDKDQQKELDDLWDEVKRK